MPRKPKALDDILRISENQDKNQAERPVAELKTGQYEGTPTPDTETAEETSSSAGFGFARIEIERYKKLEKNGYLLQLIPIKNIESPEYNPREIEKLESTDSFKAMVSSIKERGLIQPISVAKIDTDRYEVVAGKTRLHATSKISDKIMCRVLPQEQSEMDKAIISIEENLLRSDTSEYEKSLQVQYLKSQGATNEYILTILNAKDRASISRRIRFAKIDPELKEELENLQDITLKLGYELAKSYDEKIASTNKEFVTKNIKHIKQKTKKKGAALAKAILAFLQSENTQEKSTSVTARNEEGDLISIKKSPSGTIQIKNLKISIDELISLLSLTK